MAGNGALDLSIRIMGKVDPSLARSISQVKGLTGSLTDGLKNTGCSRKDWPRARRNADR